MDEAARMSALNSAPRHKMVTCQKCGKRWLVEFSEGQSARRCPMCKASFLISCHDEVVTVVFDGD